MENGLAARRSTSLGARVGARVKYERDRQGLTRQGLGVAAGLSLSYLQQLERGGYKNPTMDTLDALARALGLTVEDLASGAPTEEERREIGWRYPELAEVVRRLECEVGPDDMDGVIEALREHLPQRPAS